MLIGPVQSREFSSVGSVTAFGLGNPSSNPGGFGLHFYIERIQILYVCIVNN